MTIIVMKSILNFQPLFRNHDLPKAQAGIEACWRNKIELSTFYYRALTWNVMVCHSNEGRY